MAFISQNHDEVDGSRLKRVILIGDHHQLPRVLRRVVSPVLQCPLANGTANSPNLQVPAAFRRLMDGDALRIGGREWTCIAGYGHAPEHISLFSATQRLLISGDMLLPKLE